VSALELPATTEELSTANVGSAATDVESDPDVASVDVPLQEASAKEATKPSKKIDFFIIFYFILHGLYPYIFTMFHPLFWKIIVVGVIYKGCQRWR